jgi:hypothetical protein
MKIFTKNALARSIGGAVLSITLLSSTAFFSNQKAEAQIPVTDAASLMQAVQDGIMRAMESEIMQTIEQTGLDMMGIFAEMNVDTINNGFGNMIARVGRAMQDIQNIEQKEKTQPAQDVCDTITLSKSLDDMLCDMEEQVSSINSATAPGRAIESGRGTAVCDSNGTCVAVDRPATLNEVKEYNAAVTKLQRETCDALIGPDGQSMCLDTTLLTSPPPQGLDAEQMKAALEMNAIAGGIITQLPRANDSVTNLKETPLHDKMLALDARSSYFKNSFKSSLDNNTILMQGTLDANNKRTPGDVINLERYLSTRMGSANWLCEITNTCSDVQANEYGEKPYVNPDELEKRKAQMDAVLLYISMQQYKSMLRIERTMADIGLLTLDNPNGDRK